MTVHQITLRAAAIAACLAFVAAGPARAQTAPWTTVGSTGTVDDSDTAIVDFALGEARVRATAAAGSELNLRYNIVSLPGFSGLGQYLMRVRFRDNGASARVRLNLRRYNTNGTSTELASFDSNAHASQVGYQTQQKCIAFDWDIDAGAHYIEARLNKTGDGGQPALAIIQLIPANCTP